MKSNQRTRPRRSQRQRCWRKGLLLGCSVNNGQEVGVSGKGGQRTNKVDVDVCKPPSWNRDLQNLCFGVAENLPSLAIQALPGPGGDILGEAFPHKPLEYQSLRSSCSRMSQGVKGGKKTSRRKPIGTMGQGYPAETSHKTGTPWNCELERWREDVSANSVTELQVCCNSAILL